MFCMDKPILVGSDLKSYSKFDFVPGEKVIFFDDFSQDNAGDFPAKWNTNGKGEVVTSNRYPGKWLKMRNSTTYIPEIVSNKFPENYTIEYDMIASGEDRSGAFSIEPDHGLEKKKTRFLMHRTPRATQGFF